MKKTIKIIILALIILFTVGITTSKAITVDKNTSASNMVSSLTNGENLRISSIIRRQNNNIFCRQYTTLLSMADYEFDYPNYFKIYTSDPSSTAYTGNTQDLRIAYILCSTTYGKDAKQQAYWWALGQKYSNAPNDLAREAANYATFIQKIQNNGSRGVTIDESKAVTTYDGNTKIYGPISISYPYSSSGFGGLKYKFTDSSNNNGNNVATLCVENNGQYNPINNTDGGNGYRKAEIDCNNKALYVKVTNSDLSKVKLEVCSFITCLEAQVYHIKGNSVSLSPAYCVDCIDNLINSNATIINEINTRQSNIDGKEKEKGTLFFDANGDYWAQYGIYKLTKITSQITSSQLKDIFRIITEDNNLFEVTAEYHPVVFWAYKCNGCGKNFNSTAAFKNHVKQNNLKEHASTTGETGMSCKICGHAFEGSRTYLQDIASHYLDNHKTNLYKRTIYEYTPWKGDGGCGYLYNGPQQNLSILATYNSIIRETTASIEIEFMPKIQKLTLVKLDAEDNTELNGAEFTATFSNVKTYNIGSQTFTGNIPYTFTVNKSITVTNVAFENKTQPITVTITENKAPNGTNSYYYKKLDGTITIEIGFGNNGLVKKSVTYDGTETINQNNVTITEFQVELKVPNIRLIDIEGTVWVDGNTGIKPVQPPNGIMDYYVDAEGNWHYKKEMRVSNVLVNLGGDNIEVYGTDGKPLSVIETKTNEEGQYEFKGLRYGRDYTVIFNYDGVHYTTSNNPSNVGEYGNFINKANEVNRAAFNSNFQTIKQGQTGTGISLSYEYNKDANEAFDIKARTSILETLAEKNYEDKGKLYPIKVSNERLEMGNVKPEFNITASTTQANLTANTNSLNLGLVKRGADFALATNLLTADVKINGKTTTYNYSDNTNYPNTNSENIIINLNKSKEQVPEYNLYLYASDYNYRIRDYVGINNIYNNEVPTGEKTGDELDVFVTYTLQVENQANVTALVNEIKYNFDEKYTLNRIYTIENGEQQAITQYSINQNVLTITKSIDFEGFGVKTLYVEFKVNKENTESLTNALKTGKFNNTAEITSYSTDEGLIDLDSQPGNNTTNNINVNDYEDDCDEASGVNIEIKDNTVRTISGTVFDQENKETKVNNVIVQLVEIKEINGKNYEYIWQETLSGTNQVKAIKYDGTSIVTYTTDVAAGSGNYKFLDYVEIDENTLVGFIPGNYIVRFIYGDGTTYNLGGNALEKVVKYNGQDYKSALNNNFADEWYDISKYESGASVAKDNEARRLETMAWSANIDAAKGILLKLLNTTGNGGLVYSDADDLNIVERKTITNYYNEKYNKNITELTNEEIRILLKETLDNTWMCADTAKINIAVDTESAQSNGANNTTVTPGNSYMNSISDINLGLLKRPETKIEIEKKLTQMVLRASDGQTIVSAALDGDEIEGQIEGLQVINMPGGEGKWIFSVSPSDINTTIDGASLEYTYKIIVKNIGSVDTLSDTLTTEYKNNNISNYVEFLNTTSNNVKKQNDENYSISKYLGSAYYKGGTDSVVKTEITSIYDYINNELTAFEDGIKNLRNIGTKNHYLLNDAYTPIELQINSVFASTATSDKMAPNDVFSEYEVKLGKNPLSSTSTLDFMNYVAEVMSYTNAAGRRALNSTPGNAEAVNKFKAIALEPDEARVEDVQIQPALGEDEKTNNIWLISIVAGVIVIATGALVTKKYIIK